MRTILLVPVGDSNPHSAMKNQLLDFWASCSFSAQPIGQSVMYSTPRARTGCKSGNRNIILTRWYLEPFEGKVLSLHLVMIHRHLYVMEITPKYNNHLKKEEAAALAEACGICDNNHNKSHICSWSFQVQWALAD